jgi:peptidoglycan hydrolase-like protein with peptidoglycan-binding domain
MPPMPPAHGAEPPAGVATWNAYTGVPDAAHPAETPATPLSELHTAASSAATKAKAAATKKGKRLLKGILHAPSVGPPAPAQENVSVATLQSALIRRGAKLTRDGLYGPKTAAAWKAAANSRHVSPMISRVGPKTARVAVQTFDVLSVPAIP